MTIGILRYLNFLKLYFFSKVSNIRRKVKVKLRVKHSQDVIDTVSIVCFSIMTMFKILNPMRSPVKRLCSMLICN